VLTSANATLTDIFQNAKRPLNLYLASHFPILLPLLHDFHWVWQLSTYYRWLANHKRPRKFVLMMVWGLMFNYSQYVKNLDSVSILSKIYWSFYVLSFVICPFKLERVGQVTQKNKWGNFSSSSPKYSML
jgi:hypothetical protein